MPFKRNLLSRDDTRNKAKELGWLDTKPTCKRIGKEGIIIEWTWRITKKKKFVTRKIGHAKGSSVIYLLAKKEIEKWIKN